MYKCPAAGVEVLPKSCKVSLQPGRQTISFVHRHSWSEVSEQKCAADCYRSSGLSEVRSDKRFRLGVGSFREEASNIVEIIELNDETGEFDCDPNLTFHHDFPPTKLMFVPDVEGCSRPDGTQRVSAGCGKITVMGAMEKASLTN
eukprot:gene18475-24970_t